MVYISYQVMCVQSLEIIIHSALQQKLYFYDIDERKEVGNDKKKQMFLFVHGGSIKELGCTNYPLHLVYKILNHIISKKNQRS